MVIIAVIFILVLFFGLPVAFVMGFSSLMYLRETGMSLLLIPQRMFVQIDSFILMAIPYFVLAGAVMNEGGFTERLIKLVRVLLGPVRGSLALVNVGGSMLFAGISGSALADTAGIGGMLIPAMVKEGYEPDFSAAVTAASSTIGPIIPPSIAFVIYGVYAEVSIAALFLGGFLPGILLGLGQMTYSFYVAVKRGYPVGEKASFKDILQAFKEALLALLAPIIIIGGILTGIFTPTEAGVVAVVYSVIIGALVFRKLKLNILPKVLVQSALTTASIFFLIGMAAVFGWIITAERIPQEVATYMVSLTGNVYLLLLLIVVFLIFMGTWMDPTANMIMLIPVLLPVIRMLGLSPIYFGVIMTFTIVLGQITPPFGLCLFIACGIAKISLEKLTMAILPFLIISIIVILLMIFWPEPFMILPNWFLGSR